MNLMRSVASLCIPLIFFSSFSHGALSTDAGKALSFFRSPDSIFPSGQLNRSILDTRLIRSEMRINFKVSWDKKTYTLPGKSVLRDIQIAEYVESKSAATLLSYNQSDASPVKSISPGARLRIITADSYWARVEDATKTQGWVPLHLLQTRREDPGVFVNLIATPLRLKAASSSRPLITIPRLERVRAMGFEKGFVKVQYSGYTGYADINHFASKGDFANLAYHLEKHWVAVTHRDNEYLVTLKGERLPLSEIKAFVTNTHRGIISEVTEDLGPQIRSQVEIVKPEAHVWGISRLDGHGEVWWQKSDLIFDEKPSDASTITTDELMKKEIYSIAFEGKNSLRGLVSAEGVYRTEDGLTWTLIPQFSKGNYPVSIHPRGAWFIGSYQSNNKGQSFEPFIRWEQVAEAIEDAYHRNPKILKITQIESLPDSKIQIFIDTGLHRVKLRSSLADMRWQVVKN